MNRPPIRKDRSGRERNCIVAKIFVDTNILIYSMDKHDAKKRRKFRDLLLTLSHDHTSVISTQVMQEFFVDATNKLNV